MNANQVIAAAILAGFTILAVAVYLGLTYSARAKVDACIEMAGGMLGPDARANCTLNSL